MPNPITGQPWPWEPQPAAPAAADTSAATLQAIRDSLTSANGGLIGEPSPVTVMGTGSQANTPLDTGYKLYTFQNGASVEINAQGQTRNYKSPPATGQTGPDIMAKSGQILAPNGQVYVKNTDTSPGAPPYVLDTQSQGNQQLANAKTVADTNYQTALAKKTDIDNQIASATDPQKAAQLANDKTQADTDYQKALAAKSNADIQYQQGMLGVSQQNANSTATTAGAAATNAQSTAQRVSAQNQLDVAQAGAATTNAQTAAGRLPSQVALDTAQAANQQAAADAARSKIGEPVMQTTGSGPTYTYWDPTTQQMVTKQNPAYLPTDPGRMTAQLKQQADAQWTALQQQVASGKLTGDQAQSQFNQYWDENIEPVKGDIAAAQAKAQSAIDQQQALSSYYNAQAANLPATLAQNASDQAQKNLISMMPYMVNASAANGPPTMTTNAKGFPQINANQIMQNATYSLPNLQEIGRQGAAAALANISPTAAFHAQTPGPMGQPQQGGFDLNSLLNQNAYGGGMPGQTAGPTNPLTGKPAQWGNDTAGWGPGFGLNLQNITGGPPLTGAPPAAPPAPPAAPPAAPPTPTFSPNPQWYQDWQASQGQSALEQGIQAQIPWPAYQPAS